MIWYFTIRVYYTNFGFLIDLFLAIAFSISLCLSMAASTATHCEKPGEWLLLLQDQKLLNGINQK